MHCLPRDCAGLIWHVIVCMLLHCSSVWYVCCIVLYCSTHAHDQRRQEVKGRSPVKTDIAPIRHIHLPTRVLSQVCGSTIVRPAGSAGRVDAGGAEARADAGEAGRGEAALRRQDVNQVRQSKPSLCVYTGGRTVFISGGPECPTQ